MCGLAGVIAAPGQRIDAHVFSCLMRLSEEHGHQGSGIAVLTASGSWRIRKTSLAAGLLMDRESTRNLLSQARAVVGHTRWATTGRVSKRNAHPFQKGDWIVAHNGMIYNWAQHAPKHAQVDSEAILSVLATAGIAGLEELDGSMAISTVNTHEKLVYLVRDGVSRLSYARDEHGNIWWATSYMHLYALLDTYALPVPVNAALPIELATAQYADPIELDIQAYYNWKGTYSSGQSYNWPRHVYGQPLITDGRKPADTSQLDGHRSRFDESDEFDDDTEWFNDQCDACGEYRLISREALIDWDVCFCTPCFYSYLKEQLTPSEFESWVKGQLLHKIV